MALRARLLELSAPIVAIASACLLIQACHCKTGCEVRAEVTKLPTRPQIGNNLCWAASSEVLTAATLSQCDSAYVASASAMAASATASCCDAAGKLLPVCDVRSWPRLRANGYSYSVLRNWPNWDVIEAEMRAKRGVAITLNYDCNAWGHMVTIIGSAEVRGDKFVEIYDSAGGEFAWSEWTPKRLPQEAPYKQGRSYFKVVKSENPQCTAVDQDPEGCDEGTPAPNPPPLTARALTVAPAAQPAMLKSQIEKAQAVAAEALECHVRQLGMQDPRSLNFEDEEEAKNAVFSKGGAIKVGFVHTGSSNCAPYTNCLDCLLFRYKVAGKDGVRGGIVVDRTAFGWKVVKVAGSKWLEDVGNLMGVEPLTPGRIIQVLIVPELSLQFVEVSTGNFRPVRDMGPFKRSKTYSKAEVTEGLSTAFPTPP